MDSEEEHKGKNFCQYHSTCGHNTDECTNLKALDNLEKQEKGKRLQKKQRFTKHEVNIMVQKQIKKAPKKKHTEELCALEKMIVSDSDQESFNSRSREEDEI